MQNRILYRGAKREGREALLIIAVYQSLAYSQFIGRDRVLKMESSLKSTTIENRMGGTGPRGEGGYGRLKG